MMVAGWLPSWALNAPYPVGAIGLFGWSAAGSEKRCVAVQDHLSLHSCSRAVLGFLVLDRTLCLPGPYPALWDGAALHLDDLFLRIASVLASCCSGCFDFGLCKNRFLLHLES
jgi:hypothetical protein